MKEEQIEEYLNYSEAVKEALIPGYEPDLKQEVVEESEPSDDDPKDGPVTGLPPANPDDDAA